MREDRFADIRRGFERRDPAATERVRDWARAAVARYARIVRPEDREDLVHEVLVHLWVRADSSRLPRESEFRSFVRRTVQVLAMDRLHRPARSARPSHRDPSAVPEAA